MHPTHRFKQILILNVFILTLGGCSKVGFQANKTNLSSLSVQNISLSTVNVNTKKNHPVTFSAGTINGQYTGILSFTTTPGLSTLTTPAGTYKIVDPLTFSITFEPIESFVGMDIVSVFATDVYGNSLPGQVNLQVGNTLNSIQPALAVRGMSCITCHSNVSSNVVTDYGFGSPWYFDTKSPDSFYADRLGQGNGLSTLNLLNGSNIIVPTAPVPAAIQSQFNVNSLADFVKFRFTQGSANLSSQVTEVPALKINLPTAARIQQIFANPTTAQVFIPDTQNSPALQGLIYDSINNVFKITSLICDGDLYLGATVMFNNAIIQSVNGCRIYSTGNVFIDTPVQSASYNGSLNYNTQIMSAQSIWMGAGRINNGAFCELDSSGKPIGWYSGSPGNVDCAKAGNAANPQCDTLTQRAYQMLKRNTYSTAYPDTTSLTALLSTPLQGGSNGAVLQARANVEASLGYNLTDASCASTGRNFATARLMLVAPYVNNRYIGAFSGSTIAEAAMMSLGNFTYTFDPVFTKVSIFSMLDAGELLSGQGI